ncbi:MAG: integrase [Holophagaceae bacterium]|nr:integrase [Holophagaceae bacterium]
MVTIRRFESLSLIRTKKTPYLIASFTVNKKRERKTTKETRIEPAWEVAMERYQAAKLRARGIEPEPTVGELVGNWVETHSLRRSASHVENLERFGRLHLGELADLKLSDATTERVERAQTAYLATHGKGTTELWRKYLRLLFKWAVARQMIKAIPWSIPRLKQQRKPSRMLPTDKVTAWVEEVDALTEHEPAIALVIRLMIGFGLRVSEACRARWEDLDFEHGIYMPAETKGREAQPRPVPYWLLENLRAIAQPHGYMVPTLEGRLVTRGRIQRVMDGASEAVDIPKLTPHKLRHTYATWMSEEGVPIQDIQAILGHKDIHTTVLYLGVDLSRVRRAQVTLAKRVQIPRLGIGSVPLSNTTRD